MSGETEQQVSGWTVDTLHSHFVDLRRTDLGNMEKRFDLAEAAVKQALDAADKASSKADAAMEKRFDGVNEFRGTLSDQANHLMPRAEAVALIASLQDKIDDLRGTRRTGVASVGAIVVGAVVVVGVLTQVIILIVTHL